MPFLGEPTGMTERIPLRTPEMEHFEVQFQKVPRVIAELGPGAKVTPTHPCILVLETAVVSLK